MGLDNTLNAISFNSSDIGYIAKGELDDMEVLLVFDTGASATILSYNLVLTKTKVKSRKIYTDVEFRFEGVGGGLVHAYFCELYDIKLDNVCINKFYCYVPIDNSGKIKNLLGRDFIHRSGFSHSDDMESVNITTFNSKKYEENVFKVYTGLLNSPYAKVVNPNAPSPLDTRDYPKNISAAFRDFYDNKFPNIKDSI